ncbi:Uncharacterised protein [Shigella sonnei]|nr:Uncharacterised protein [Shigella sonnei]CSI82033.1 Uncharacterised protein [Shigella sonnei]
MYFLLQAHLSHLKPGLPHSDAKGFCLRAARYHTAIVIAEYDDRFVAKVRAENFFT